jgi:ubiquinone/menaquinone biosynthesis C-methylase UbiE
VTTTPEVTHALALAGLVELAGERIGQMHCRDRDGVEPAEIAGVVELAAKRVLDVGCGTGRLTSFAARAASHVYAFDPDAESVAQARGSLPPELRKTVSFGVHSAEALDVPRRRFDIALCGWSL